MDANQIEAWESHLEDDERYKTIVLRDVSRDVVCLSFTDFKANTIANRILAFQNKRLKKTHGPDEIFTTISIVQMSEHNMDGARKAYQNQENRLGNQHKKLPPWRYITAGEAVLDSTADPCGLRIKGQKALPELLAYDKAIELCLVHGERNAEGKTIMDLRELKTRFVLLGYYYNAENLDCMLPKLPASEVPPSRFQQHQVAPPFQQQQHAQRPSPSPFQQQQIALPLQQGPAMLPLPFQQQHGQAMPPSPFQQQQGKLSALPYQQGRGPHSTPTRLTTCRDEPTPVQTIQQDRRQQYARTQSSPAVLPSPVRSLTFAPAVLPSPGRSLPRTLSDRSGMGMMPRPAIRLDAQNVPLAYNAFHGLVGGVSTRIAQSEQGRQFDTQVLLHQLAQNELARQQDAQSDSSLSEMLQYIMEASSDGGQPAMEDGQPQPSQQAIEGQVPSHIQFGQQPNQGGDHGFLYDEQPEDLEQRQQEQPRYLQQQRRHQPMGGQFQSRQARNQLQSRQNQRPGRSHREVWDRRCQQSPNSTHGQTGVAMNSHPSTISNLPAFQDGHYYNQNNNDFDETESAQKTLSSTKNELNAETAQPAPNNVTLATSDVPTENMVPSSLLTNSTPTSDKKLPASSSPPSAGRNSLALSSSPNRMPLSPSNLASIFDDNQPTVHSRTAAAPPFAERQPPNSTGMALAKSAPETTQRPTKHGRTQTPIPSTTEPGASKITSNTAPSSWMSQAIWNGPPQTTSGATPFIANGVPMDAPSGDKTNGQSTGLGYKASGFGTAPVPPSLDGFAANATLRVQPPNSTGMALTSTNDTSTTLATGGFGSNSTTGAVSAPLKDPPFGTTTTTTRTVETPNVAPTNTNMQSAFGSLESPGPTVAVAAAASNAKAQPLEEAQENGAVVATTITEALVGDMNRPSAPLVTAEANGSTNTQPRPTSSSKKRRIESPPTGGSTTPTDTQQSFAGGPTVPTNTQQPFAGGSTAPTNTQQPFAGGSTAPTDTQQPFPGGSTAPTNTQQSFPGGSTAPTFGTPTGGATAQTQQSFGASNSFGNGGGAPTQSFVAPNSFGNGIATTPTLSFGAPNAGTMPAPSFGATSAAVATTGGLSTQPSTGATIEPAFGATQASIGGPTGAPLALDTVGASTAPGNAATQNDDTANGGVVAVPESNESASISPRSRNDKRPAADMSNTVEPSHVFDPYRQGRAPPKKTPRDKFRQRRRPTVNEPKATEALGLHSKPLDLPQKSPPRKKSKKDEIAPTTLAAMQSAATQDPVTHDPATMATEGMQDAGTQNPAATAAEEEDSDFEQGRRLQNEDASPTHPSAWGNLFDNAQNAAPQNQEPLEGSVQNTVDQVDVETVESDEESDEERNDEQPPPMVYQEALLPMGVLFSEEDLDLNVGWHVRVHVGRTPHDGVVVRRGRNRRLWMIQSNAVNNGIPVQRALEGLRFVRRPE